MCLLKEQWSQMKFWCTFNLSSTNFTKMLTFSEAFAILAYFAQSINLLLGSEPRTLQAREMLFHLAKLSVK